MNPLKTACVLLLTCCSISIAPAGEEPVSMETFTTTYAVDLLIGNWKTGDSGWVTVFETESLEEAKIAYDFYRDEFRQGTLEDLFGLGSSFIILDVRLRESEVFNGISGGQPEIIDLSDVRVTDDRPAYEPPTYGHHTK